MKGECLEKHSFVGMWGGGGGGGGGWGVGGGGGGGMGGGMVDPSGPRPK